MKLVYKIDERIFNKTPNYIRTVIIVRDINNGKGSLLEYQKLMHLVSKLNNKFKEVDIASLKTVLEWKLAFNKFGIKSEYKPSYEALIKRVVKKPKSFRSINPIVDFGNFCSLKYQRSIGIHPIKGQVMNVSLTLAKGTEQFVEFGKDKLSNPKLNEIILKDKDSVLTRNWVWRQGSESIITNDTRSIFINVDFLNDNLDLVKQTTEEIASLFSTHFNVASAYDIINKKCQQIEF